MFCLLGTVKENVFLIDFICHFLIFFQKLIDLGTHLSKLSYCGIDTIMKEREEKKCNDKTHSTSIIVALYAFEDNPRLNTDNSDNC